MEVQEIFDALYLTSDQLQGGDLDVYSPATGEKIASVKKDTVEGAKDKIALSVKAFKAWRDVPAPARGELVRHLGDVLRDHKEALGSLVTLECGKIYQEGLGEVQEMIDICDFALGQSRMMHGLTIVSERPLHKMREYWHSVGPVGIISAFNFPVAVWAWNAALALVCGDSTIWKPSEKTPLTAMACQNLFDLAAKRFSGDVPEGLSQVLIGERDIGEIMVEDKRVPIISATGSTAMGRIVGQKVAARFGKSILELGGNNALVITPSADLNLAFAATLFGSVGTCGQRCTSTRRLFVHEDIYDKVIPRLKKAYKGCKIGHPLDESTLIGPLVDQQSFENMEAAVKLAVAQGGSLSGGGRAMSSKYPKAYYVHPAIVEMDGAADNVQEETFAPILYVFKYNDFEEVVQRVNDVPQGLSSAVFTRDVLEAEIFTSEYGSDCGIANVNIGTSGAEIGGAFGGEKETGGGRESGSDAWKGYMRRMTSTVNYSKELPLAQGIKFDIEEG